MAEGADVTYAAVMAAAKERVKLSDCGIQAPVRIKHAQTGGIIIEVPGPDRTSKVVALEAKLRQALSDLALHIARPVKSGEVRMMGLDEAVIPEEIAASVAGIGGYAVSDVRVGELRRSRCGMFSAWVHCPLTAVRKLEAAKRIAVF